MHNNVIIGFAVLLAFVLSIVLALYGMRFVDRDRRWRPRRYGFAVHEMPCSFCGKAVRAEAIVCRHCHHRLDEAEAGAMAGEEGPEIAHPSSRLIAVGPQPELIEDLSQNQAFVWLDKGFAQLTVKEAPTLWGTAMEESPDGPTSRKPGPVLDAEPEDESDARNELMIRTLGPLSTPPQITADLHQPSWWHLPSGWRPSFAFEQFDLAKFKTERGLAVGIAVVALIIGGIGMTISPSPALRSDRDAIVDAATTANPAQAASVGIAATVSAPTSPPSTAPSKTDNYVTFDVSERAPLFTGPTDKITSQADASKAPPIAAQKSEAPASAKVDVPVMKVEPPPAVDVAKDAIPAQPAPAAMASVAASEALKAEPPKAAVPTLLPAPSPENAAATTPIAMAALTQPAAPAVEPKPREDWANNVARAIKVEPNKDLIVAVQRLIRAEGYDPGQIDGVVGPRTRRAILAYQRNGSLPLTGEIDRDLLVKLNLADRTVRVVGPISGIASRAK